MGGEYRAHVGEIVELSPALDEATKAEFRKWGPGKTIRGTMPSNGMKIIPTEQSFTAGV